MVNVYIESYGCSSNIAEGEHLAGILSKAGFNIVENACDAFVIIVNVCTVKGDAAAVRHVRHLYNLYPDKKFIVAGCLTANVLSEVRKFDVNAGFISTHNIKHIVEVIEEVLNDNAVELISYSKDVKVNLPKIMKNKVIGIIPILSGCNGSCAYCSVRLIKGELYSYPVEDILQEVRKALGKGAKEVWITSQDNACYMLEKGKSRLVYLLKQVTSLNGDFKVRLGMMNPNNVLLILDELVEVYKSEKMFKFLHLPVQAGNDKVLESMNRQYKVEDFKKIINKFKQSIPNITIATDIICGFPGETNKQFIDSVELIRWLSPDIVNISRFRAREGTKAFEMEQVEGAELKRRSQLLASIFGNISLLQNEPWLNWEGYVLVDECGKEGSWIAHNFAYKPVILEGNFKLGDKVRVKIVKTTKYYLRGEITSWKLPYKSLSCS